MPAEYAFGSPEFHEAASAAGLSVFYLDHDGLEVMEQPDGCRFEIRFLPGAPGGSNYEVLRELKTRAA